MGTPNKKQLSVDETEIRNQSIGTESINQSYSDDLIRATSIVVGQS